MPDEDHVRLEIGFDGGQIVGVLTSVASADALDAALATAAAAGGIAHVESDDGVYTVVLQRVVYVKRHARESRVGFGAG